MPFAQKFDNEFQFSIGKPNLQGPYGTFRDLVGPSGKLMDLHRTFWDYMGPSGY